MKRKAISELTPTLKEHQRFLGTDHMWSVKRAAKLRKVNMGKIWKMLQNWQKYAPQTDDDLERESPVTEDKTENGTTNKQQLKEMELM